MKIIINESTLSNEIILDLVIAKQAEILNDFCVSKNGQYSNFNIEISSNGGYIKPGLVSCWVEKGSQDTEIIEASICHELVHYTLQIDSLLNPTPSSFVNEGIAQSYAEGKFLEKSGNSYIKKWLAIEDENWPNKIVQAMCDDAWFLKFRMSDKSVGIGNAALFEWIKNSHGFQALVNIFRMSLPNKSCSYLIKTVCGSEPLEILSNMQNN